MTTLAPLGLDLRTAGRELHDDDLDDLVRRAVDVGTGLLAWSDVDEDGRAGESIGRVLRRHRDGLALAVSIGHLAPDPILHPGLTPAHPRWLLRTVDAALRATCAEQLAVVQLDVVDRRARVEDSIALLQRLVGEGKVASLGLGGRGPDQLVDDVGRSHEVGSPPFELTRAELTVGAEPVDDELDAAIAEAELAVIATSTEPEGRAGELLLDWSRHRGVSSLSAAAGWTLRRPSVACAALDTVDATQLVRWLDGASVPVPPDGWDEVDDLVSIGRRRDRS